MIYNKKIIRYSLGEAIKAMYQGNLELSPLLDGEEIKEGTSEFLIPRHFDSRKKVKFLCDFHGWIGPKPFNFYGFPISQKMKELLEKFNLSGMSFHPVKVLFDNEHYNYFGWEVKSEIFDNYIDFNSSTFCEWKKMEKVGVKSFKTESLRKIKKIKRENNWRNWGFDRAVMKPEFKEIDCMSMPYPYGILISERLKNALEEAELTGFEITPFPVEFEYME